MNNMKRRNLFTLLMMLLLIAMMVVACVGMSMLRHKPTMLQGEVEANVLRISGKLPGRVAHLLVSEGDRVEAGDTLVHIHSSLVEAQLSQAVAMQHAAEAENELVDAGTRREAVRVAYDILLQAQAALSIADKSYRRTESLYKQGVVSEQRRDEALAAYEMASAAEGAARSQYDMALNGARREEKDASKAMLQVAKGGVAEVEAIMEDAALTAPRAGVVSDIFPLEGELVSLGAPIMNLLLPDEVWITLRVREEFLQYLAIGSSHRAVVPALGDKEISLQVYYVKDMGSYAVWRATRASGQYDAKTFAVRLKPIDEVQGLLPGMTVLFSDLYYKY